MQLLKALISYAVTAQLICVFVFADSNCWISDAAAQLVCQEFKTLCFCCQMPHGQSEDYNMYITLSHDHVQMLKNFVLTGNQRHIHDVNDILTGMVNRVISSRMGRIEKFIEWVESKIGVSLHRILQVI